jgi:hypothetical protein
MVVTGFEPLDLLQGIHMAVDALEAGRTGVENQYVRTVSREGNPAARAVVNEVFETCDRAWRGIGVIPKSGYRLRPEYAAYDATLKFEVGAITTEEPKECIAGEIMQGLKPGRVLRVRHALHARAPSRRADGLVRGRLRGVLALRESVMAETKPPSPDLGAALAAASCPVPGAGGGQTILMAHGGGGRLTQRLIESLFLKNFDNPALRELHDGAILEAGGMRLAFSTDSFVIHPLFFPGGDIGSLAVHGTVNDLAMCGAQPLGLSAALILEEGLPIADLGRIVASMQRAAAGAGASIVTGDTKVVDRGKGDGVFVNVTGVGIVPPGVVISPRRAAPGDVVLVSGEIAVHGIAIMSLREGLRFETTLESDTAAAERPGRGPPRGRRRRRPCPARPDARRRRVDAERDRGPGGGRNPPRGGEAPGRRGGARRLRDPRPRSALRRERGQAPRDRRA